MEFRIYAEDPAAGFLPAPGRIRSYREPGGPWVRVDSGVSAGWEVPIHYDPMIAKLVVWGSDRADCIRRSDRALREYRITGIRNTIGFFRHVLADPDFVRGVYDTSFLSADFLATLGSEEQSEVAAVAAAISQFEKDVSVSPATRVTSDSPWKRRGRWEAMQKP
jgi:acetyl-CoA carboxylase biotin carboxylase subunit